MAESFIQLVKDERPEVADFLPEKASAALLLEFEGQTEEEVAAQMEKCLAHLESQDLVMDVKVASFCPAAR